MDGSAPNHRVCSWHLLEPLQALLCRENSHSGWIRITKPDQCLLTCEWAGRSLDRSCANGSCDVVSFYKAPHAEFLKLVCAASTGDTARQRGIRTPPLQARHGRELYAPTRVPSGRQIG